MVGRTCERAPGAVAPRVARPRVGGVAPVTEYREGEGSRLVPVLRGMPDRLRGPTLPTCTRRGHHLEGVMILDQEYKSGDFFVLFTHHCKFYSFPS